MSKIDLSHSLEKQVSGAEEISSIKISGHV